jgi:hypothetical protein
VKCAVVEFGCSVQWFSQCELVTKSEGREGGRERIGSREGIS